MVNSLGVATAALDISKLLDSGATRKVDPPSDLKAYTRSNGSVQPPYEQSPAPSVLPPLSTASTPATTTSRPGSGSLGPPPVPSPIQLPPVASLHSHQSPYHHALEHSHHYAPPYAVGTPYSHHLHGSVPGFGGNPVGGVPQKRSAGHLGPPPSAPPPKKMGKWTPEEDAIAIELRRKGMKWDDISKQLPGRSPISCRLRYQNYSEKRPDWDEEKKDKLARLYNRYVL